jgi:hypothetical protein
MTIAKLLTDSSPSSNIDNESLVTVILSFNAPRHCIWQELINLHWIEGYGNNLVCVVQCLQCLVAISAPFDPEKNHFQHQHFWMPAWLPFSILKTWSDLRPFPGWLRGSVVVTWQFKSTALTSAINFEPLMATALVQGMSSTLLTDLIVDLGRFWVGIW